MHPTVPTPFRLTHAFAPPSRSGNNIGAEGAVALALALTCLTSLQILNIESVAHPQTPPQRPCAAPPAPSEWRAADGKMLIEL